MAAPLLSLPWLVLAIGGGAHAQWLEQRAAPSKVRAARALSLSPTAHGWRGAFAHTQLLLCVADKLPSQQHFFQTAIAAAATC